MNTTPPPDYPFHADGTPIQRIDFVAAAAAAANGQPPAHLQGPQPHQYLPGPPPGIGGPSAAVPPGVAHLPPHPPGQPWYDPAARQQAGTVPPVRQSYQVEGSTLTPVTPVTPPPAPVAPAAAAPAAMLAQLATLEVWESAVAEARRQGGPTPALRALVQKPLNIGGFQLQKVSVATFTFLNALGGPFVEGRDGLPQPQEVAEALLGFLKVGDMEEFLDFTDDGLVKIRRAAVAREAFRLSAEIPSDQLIAVGSWIAAQMHGINSIIRKEEPAPAATGEEAENFQTGAAAPPAPPAGVSSC